MTQLSASPDDVHALPEARGGEQDGVRGLPEACEQGRTRGRPLHENRVVERGFDVRLHGAEHRVAREQDEGAPARAAQDGHDLACGRVAEGRGLRRRHPPRQVQDRLPRVIELGGQAQLARRAAHAEAAAHVLERPADGQRRRGQHRGGPALEHVLAHDLRDVDRRRAEEHAAPTHLEEVHVVAVRRAQQEPEVVAQLPRAPGQ